MKKTTQKNMNFPDVKVRRSPIEQNFEKNRPEASKMRPIFLSANFGAERQFEPWAPFRNYSGDRKLSIPALRVM